MEQDPKNYEFAYLLSPTLAEEEALIYVGKLSKIIEEAGGRIRRTEKPRKQKLAYDIKKQRNAYFGWTTFSLLPDAVAKLEKRLKTENILRFLIAEEEESHARPQILRVIPSRPVPTHTPAQLHPAEKQEEKLDLEALDKKLEEILGK